MEVLWVTDCSNLMIVKELSVVDVLCAIRNEQIVARVVQFPST